MNKRVVAVLVLVLLGFCCRAAAAQERLEVGRFSLKPAAGWEVIRDGLPTHYRVALMAPRTATTKEDLRPSLTVLVESVDADETVDRYFARNKAQMKSDPHVKYYTETCISLGGRTAGRLVWSTVMQGVDVKFHVTAFLAGGHLYVVTGTAESRTYDRYALDFEKMADSFRLAP